jgi:hypothetical protein
MRVAPDLAAAGAGSGAFALVAASAASAPGWTEVERFRKRHRTLVLVRRDPPTAP